MDSTDGIIEKIKKAMRLAAKAATEGERIAAENAAKRLAEAHDINLSEVDVKGDSEVKAVMRESDREYRRTGAEVGFATMIIRKHFGVVIMQSYRKRSNRTKFVFFGVNINIEIAKYVYDILQREFYHDFRQAKAWGITSKRAFMTGWFMKIDKKLTEHPIRNDTEQYEEERKAAERKFADYMAKDDTVKNKTIKGDKRDSEALYRGYMSADRVNLSRPCEGRASASPFAIGHTPALKGGV